MAWPISAVIGSQDLQRSKPFGLAIMAVAPASRCPDREDHRQAQGDGEVEVELGADVGIMVPASLRLLRRHAAGEDRWADVAEVEGRCADFGEADWGKVHFACDPGKLPRRNLVDFEAGEALHFTIALLRPIIDVVVAER